MKPMSSSLAKIPYLKLGESFVTPRPRTFTAPTIGAAACYRSMQL
jgi:hypothetical protein